MILKATFQPFKLLSDPEEYFEREDLDEDIENQVLSDTAPIQEEEDYPYTDFEHPTVDGYEDPELYDADEEFDMSDYDDEDRDYDAIDDYDSIFDNQEDLNDDDDEYEEYILDDKYEYEELDLSDQEDDGICPSPFDEYDDIGIIEDPDLTEV